MSDTLENICALIQTYISGVSGIRKAPAKAPDSMAVFPFSLIYPADGTWEIAPALTKKGLHNIVVEIHVARRDLPRDIEAVIPYCESIPNKLFSKLVNDGKWQGKVDTIGPINYTFGVLGYGGVETLGFKFTITGVKAQSAIT